MKKFKSHMNEAAPKVDPDKYAAHMARNKKPKKITSTQKSISDVAKKAEKMAMKEDHSEKAAAHRRAAAKTRDPRKKALHAKAAAIHDDAATALPSEKKKASDAANKFTREAGLKTEGVKGALGGALGGGAAGAAAGYKYMGKPGAVVGGLGGALIGGSFGSGAEDGYKFARRPKKKKVQEGSCGSSTRKKNISEYSDEELASHANKAIADKKKAAIEKDEVAKPTDREDRAVAHLRKRRPGSDLTKDKEER